MAKQTEEIITREWVDDQGKKRRTIEVVETKVISRITNQTIYLNEADIVDRLIGDDDGDIVGVSNDPEIVHLFNDRVSNLVRKIEPKGDNQSFDPESEAGQDYMWQDQTGAVGLLTLIRSRLLAAQLWNEADGISCLIQEAVDKKKRIPAWTNWIGAADLDNWDQDDQGRWHLNKNKVPPTTKVHGGHVDVKAVRAWAFGEMKRLGYKQDRDGEILSWKQKDDDGENTKSIDPNNWAQADSYFRNLVHHCHDYALGRWLEVRDEFMGEINEDIDSGLLFRAWSALGEEVYIQDMSWSEYERGLRTKAGIDDLAAQLRTMYEEELEPEKKWARFGAIQAEHQQIAETLSPQEQAQIWFMEAQYRHAQRSTGNPVSNVNYAFYTTLYENSQLSRAMGVTEGFCEFLSPKTIQYKGRPRTINPLDEWVAECLQAPDPIQHLIQILEGELGGEHIRSQEVPALLCRDCTTRLQQAVVHAIRRDKTRKDHDFGKALILQLKGKPRQPKS